MPCPLVQEDFRVEVAYCFAETSQIELNQPSVTDRESVQVLNELDEVLLGPLPESE